MSLPVQVRLNKLEIKQKKKFNKDRAILITKLKVQVEYGLDKTPTISALRRKGLADELPRGSSGSISNETHYLCSHCKQTKKSSQFHGKKRKVCSSCVRKTNHPKRLLVKYENRLAKNEVLHPEHWSNGKESKGRKRLVKRIEKCKARVSVGYLARKRALTVRGKRNAECHTIVDRRTSFPRNSS